MAAANGASIATSHSVNILAALCATRQGWPTRETQKPLGECPMLKGVNSEDLHRVPYICVYLAYCRDGYAFEWSQRTRHLCKTVGRWSACTDGMRIQQPVIGETTRAITAIMGAEMMNAGVQDHDCEDRSGTKIR